ncbi:MAG: helix-turn-helix domain-containing protein [Verrucomicrobiae bacterium]|nr:helix-turn-helix domain-containing protein [Verrucomicrobiae bacterium]
MFSLDDLLDQTEGKTLEFKRDASSPDRIIATVVAFANSAGGVILIGVEDRTRHVRGVDDPSRLEEHLANLIWDRIEPRLVPDMQIVPWRKESILAIRVYPSMSRPHWIKQLGNGEGVYVRVGSTNRRADPAQIDELRRSIRGRTFDEEPLAELHSEAIDFRAASECFSPKRVLQRKDLRTMQITACVQGREAPTVGGLLLFGKKRLEMFPDSKIRLGCFAGADKSHILDSAEVVSYPVFAIDEILAFVQRNTRRGLRIEGARNVESWDFPMLAIREAVINAIVHADYSQRGMPLKVSIFDDRIEIENPGGLPPGLTIEEIRHGLSKLRNRVMGRVFYELGLIEQWGSGIQRMTKTCVEAGLPEPLLAEMGPGFRVTFFRHRSASQARDPLDQMILDALAKQPGLPTCRIAREIKRTPRATRDRLARLLKLGLIVAIGSSAKDPRKTFRLAAISS